MEPTRFLRVPITEVVQQGILPETTPTRPVTLVVDDEAVIADSLVAILNQNGFAATATYSAAAALQMAKIVPPELLISDIGMPGMSGIQLAAEMRIAVPDCCVILLTGHAVTMDLLMQAQSGDYKFPILSKPIHPDELIARIHAL